MGVFAHLVNTEIVADGIEEVVAGVAKRRCNILLGMRIMLALNAVPDPAFRRVSFGGVLGEDAFTLDLVFRVDLAFRQDRRRDTGLESRAGCIGAHQCAVEERCIRCLHQFLIFLNYGGTVISRPACDGQRFACVDLHHNRGGAGDLVLHFRVIVPSFEAFGALLVSVQDHGVDRVVQDTFRLLLQHLVNGQIDMRPGLRFFDVDGTEHRAGVVLRLAYLAILAVQVFLKGVFHTVLADHGVIGIVQKRIALILLLGHQSGVAEDVCRVFRLVIADVGTLNLNADQFVLHDGRNQFHTGVFHEQIFSRVDRVADIDRVADPGNDAHLFAGVAVVDAVARTHKAQQFDRAGVFRQAVRLLPDKIGFQHRTLDIRHVLVVFKRRCSADGQIVRIVISEALHHMDQLQNDRIRIFVCKQLDIVYLEVVALLVADHDSAVAVKNVSSRSSNRPLRICYFVALVVVFFPLDDLKAIQEGQVNHEDQNDQHNHCRDSAGFYEMFHESLLYSSLLRRAGGK